MIGFKSMHLASCREEMVQTGFNYSEEKERFLEIMQYIVYILNIYKYLQPRLYTNLGLLTIGYLRIVYLLKLKPPLYSRRHDLSL